MARRGKSGTESLTPFPVFPRLQRHVGRRFSWNSLRSIGRFPDRILFCVASKHYRTLVFAFDETPGGPGNHRRPALNGEKVEQAFKKEEEAIQRFTIHLNAMMTGIVVGLLCGVGLFLATILLVLKGGPHPGEHLRLLWQYFPGYSVTVAGSFVGFLYGALVGFLCGWVIGSVYNKLAR